MMGFCGRMQQGQVSQENQREDLESVVGFRFWNSQYISVQNPYDPLYWVVESQYNWVV